MLFNNSERAKALVNAPGDVAPQTFLTDVKDIRKAIDRNLNGGNYGVYCFYEGGMHRISKVRTRKGEVEVRLLNSGSWVVPTFVSVRG